MSTLNGIKQGLFNAAAGIAVNYFINPQNAFVSYYPYAALTTIAAVGLSFYYFQPTLPEEKIKKTIGRVTEIVKNNPERTVAAATGALIGGIYQGMGGAITALAIGGARIWEAGCITKQPSTEKLQKQIKQLTEQKELLVQKNNGYKESADSMLKEHANLVLRIYRLKEEIDMHNTNPPKAPANEGHPSPTQQLSYMEDID